MKIAILGFLCGCIAVCGADSQVDGFESFVITQRISTVFGNAKDREIDRLRLMNAAERRYYELTQSSTNSIAGLRLVCVVYEGTNVVARYVFRAERDL